MDRYLIFVVSKGTKLAVGTERLKRGFIIGIGGIFSRDVMFLTKFAFVTTWMIELLYFVMGKLTIFIEAATS